MESWRLKGLDYSITQRIRKMKKRIRFRTSVPSCPNVDYLNQEIDRELQKLHFQPNRMLTYLVLVAAVAAVMGEIEDGRIRILSALTSPQALQVGHSSHFYPYPLFMLLSSLSSIEFLTLI